MTTAGNRTALTMRSLDCPEDGWPIGSCGHCEEGEVWEDGLVPGIADQEGWKPVCDDCLEREHPVLLESVRWLRALCGVIDEGCVTPAALEQHKRVHVAQVDGPDAAASPAADELPDLANWHSSELALTIALAQTRMAAMKRHDVSLRALAGRIGLIESGPSALDERIYEAADEDEKPEIAAAVRERLALRQQLRRRWNEEGQHPGNLAAEAFKQYREHGEPLPPWITLLESGGYAYKWWGPLSVEEREMLDVEHLVPSALRSSYLRWQLESISDDPPDLTDCSFCRADQSLAAALSHQCDHSISLAKAAGVVQQVTKYRQLKLSAADRKTLTRVARDGSGTPRWSTPWLGGQRRAAYSR